MENVSHSGAESTLDAEPQTAWPPGDSQRVALQRGIECAGVKALDALLRIGMMGLMPPCLRGREVALEVGPEHTGIRIDRCLCRAGASPRIAGSNSFSTCYIAAHNAEKGRMDVPAIYHGFTYWVGDGTGLPDAILHIHAGMAILLLARALTRRSLATAVPLGCVAIAGAANEVLDCLYFHSWRWPDTLEDMANTLFWPTMICAAIRSQPLVRSRRSAPGHHISGGGGGPRTAATGRVRALRSEQKV